MSLRRQNGFTLVELMVTVAVLAVLSTIAYPSFQSTIRSNRVATTTNELIASLALARSEAIKTRVVGLYAHPQRAKSDGSSWADGWMVWEDRNGNGALDSGENVLRYSEGRPTMKSATEALTIGFDGRGRNRANAEVDVTLRPEKCGDQPCSERCAYRLRDRCGC